MEKEVTGGYVNNLCKVNVYLSEAKRHNESAFLGASNHDSNNGFLPGTKHISGEAFNSYGTAATA